MDSYRQEDVIAAEATPRGRGGISVIRLSGRDARVVAERIVEGKLPEAGRVARRWIVDPRDGSRIDEAVVTFFEDPRSYTGDDLIELSLHGNPILVAEALDALYFAGARPASPGEFTYRAFLNGRIDLTQAEAVGDLIAAPSVEAARAASRQLEGKLGRELKQIAEVVQKLLITSELELDFVEEDVELMGRNERLEIVDQAERALQKLLGGYQASRHLREGVRVAIYGAPNVGKSSLFNALVGVDRAIVHQIPGTTRDIISGKVVLGGVEFEFFDTAGIRDTGEEVESEGIRRARELTKQVDLTIELDSIDIPANTRSRSVDKITVTNKCDLDGHITGDIAISTIAGIGIEELRQTLIGWAIGGWRVGSVGLNRERHFALATEALGGLQRGREALILQAPAEVVAEEWRSALAALDEITGSTRRSDLLHSLFASFCIGK